ncbi:MAG: LuxR C-terminal-related transcriptional regulator [Candidatus Thiodiazotropha sp.]
MLTLIARQLALSPNTVSGYNKAIYQKLNIRSCSEATLEAVRRGLVRE